MPTIAIIFGLSAITLKGTINNKKTTIKNIYKIAIISYYFVGIMKFILIRHCETDWNVIHRIQGHSDTLLNENGRRQSKEIAEKLKLAYSKINRIISSDLHRASETAETISKIMGVSFFTDPRLRECNHGILEGMMRDEAEKLYPKVRDFVLGTDHQRGIMTSYDFSDFGGENENGVFKRHISAVQGYVRQYPDELILLVGHGRGLNTLLKGLGYLPDLVRGNFREIDFV